MEEEKKNIPVDPERPKEKSGWEPNGCPFFIFGDEDAAEYDIEAIKSFFSRFKKKKE